MASKGLYINTPLARRILRDVLKAHRNLLASGEVEPSSVAELREIIHKIENSLYEPTDGEGDELGQMEQILRLKGQIVLAGPPGVGKTYQALRLAARMLGLDPEDDEGRKERQLAAILRQNPDLQGDSARLAQAVLSGPPPRGVWDIVQFHSSYTYEDFVRGIQAEPERDGIVFRPVNRLLGTLAELARRLGPEVPVVLVVDEINRGDLAKVLGELIYSLEYRDHVVLTPYAVNGRPGLEIPANFYLIGTMNTADRAIALVDYAIRRRFSFIHLAPDRDVVAMHYEDPVLREKALHLFDQVQKLFVEVGAGYVAEDLAVGHSYFLASDADDLASRIAFEVAPLLVEYYKEGILVDPPVLNLEGKVNLVEVDPLQLERQVRGWLAGE
jgi:5-methylcytosine-specific restriction protein B